jgi:hypothetical protein
MDTARIQQILAECLGNEGEPGVEVVDVWLDIAMRTDKVREFEPEMNELLKEWPKKIDGAEAPLGGELSYLQVGSVLGDPQMAFMLFAFGKLLGWWTVMTPATMLGFSKDNAMAQDMAGMGFIAVNGYSPDGVMP